VTEAEAVGVSPDEISRIERGAREPRFDTIERQWGFLMLKLLLIAMVLAAGSCSSGSLRSGGTGGHGGNTGSGGNTGGATAGTGGLTISGGTVGAGGTGGSVGSGGSGGVGGAGGSGGAAGYGASGGSTSSPDAGLEGPLDGGKDVTSADGILAPDAAASSCENPLPLRCGDRLNHSTLVQGRANVWSTYGCTQRWMSGREAIYVIQPSTACQVSVQLKNLTVST
jgi:hypothetical protein